MKERSLDSPGLVRFRDAMTAIGIALGGGALLLAAVMHLAAPVIVMRPTVAIGMLSVPAAQPTSRRPVRATVARAIAKPPQAKAAKHAVPVRAARTAPRIPNTVSTVPPVVVVIRAHRSAVELRVVRVASRQNTTMPTRKASAPIAPSHRRASAKLASRRSARVAPTPEPPVGFDSRPTLVEAPIPGVGSANLSSSDAGIAALRIRGRLLATPAPEAAKTSP